MTIIQNVLSIVLPLVQLCISISCLITSIQSFVYNRKREKRELAQVARDLEYHKKRMKTLKKINISIG